MSPQLNSFDDVQCEEIWEIAESEGSLFPVDNSDPDHLCFRDEFGYCHEFDRGDIQFICEYQQLRNWGTPGYFALLRDLLTSGF